MAKYSLHSIHPRRFDLYALWFVSAGALAAGLSLPVITFKELIFRTTTFSIITGVVNLCQERYLLLAAVVFIFSVLFPILKLTALLLLWFWPLTKSKRFTFLEFLSNLGKWSMLDVYLVAITIVIAKGSTMVKASPRIGIYFFGVSILLSIILSTLVKRLAKKAHFPQDSL